MNDDSVSLVAAVVVVAAALGAGTVILRFHKGRARRRAAPERQARDPDAPQLAAEGFAPVAPAVAPAGTIWQPVGWTRPTREEPSPSDAQPARRRYADI